MAPERDEGVSKCESKWEMESVVMRIRRAGRPNNGNITRLYIFHNNQHRIAQHNTASHLICITSACDVKTKINVNHNMRRDEYEHISTICNLPAATIPSIHALLHSHIPSLEGHINILVIAIHMASVVIILFVMSDVMSDGIDMICVCGSDAKIYEIHILGGVVVDDVMG